MVRKDTERPSLKLKLEKAMEDMGPFSPMTETASTLTLLCLEEIMANIDGTIKGEDPEYLHDMRVSSRRLRAALRLFSPCYPTTFRKAQEKARSVTTLLGFVRDLDVRMIHLNNIKGLVGKDGERGAEVLLFNTSMQWEEARARMIDGLVGLRDGDWYPWMLETLGHPRVPDGKHWFLAIHALPTVDRNKAMVGSASHLAGIEGAVSAQHELRIAIKRYRYSLELLRFCFEEGIEDTIVRCKTLQDDLGLMHDYDILSQHIHGSKSRTLPKNIKKGLDELKVTIKNLRHQQFELFNEHFMQFLGMDPLAPRT